MSFATAHPTLAAALAEHGYASPTPVQASVLEPEVAGRDLLVSARTGSGKTVAFGLCLAENLLGEATTLGHAGAPLALVVAPTRELALQVRHELAWLWAPAGARVISCVGGMDVRREARALADGAHIVVGTPGRLCDHLDRGALRLGSVRAVVLDEADEMLDLGFREELEKLLDATPTERRTLLFSATLPPGILGLASRYQRDALRIAASSADEPHADIEHRAVLIAPREREHAIVNLLRYVAPPTALVFCATREGVSHLHASLVERGFTAVALSGELTQAERGRALQALRDGRARVLVATDVAARGLDLPDLQLVIHADLPHDAQVLLHRSGRTGRAGKKGTSVMIVSTTRRRAADRLIREARIEPRWSEPPTAEAVRAKDQERITTELETVVTEPAEEERAAAAALLEKHAPEAVAAALIRLYRQGWPDPEELPETEAFHNRGAGPRRRDVEEPRPLRVKPGRLGHPHEAPIARGHARVEGPPDAEGPEAAREAAPADAGAEVAAPPQGRTPRRKAPDAVRPEGPPRTPRRREEHVEEGAEPDEGVHGVWFRMNVGRANNADPRWLVPLLCRRGRIEKADIGAIRILDTETRFEIASNVAGRFAAAVRRPDPREPWVRIVTMDRW